MTAPNLLALTTATGKTAVLAVTTTATAIVSNAAASGKLLKINALTIANIDGANAAGITVEIYRSSTAYELAKTIAVAADATLVVLSKDMQMYLEEGDSLRVKASADSDLMAICSYEELS